MLEPRWRKLLRDAWLHRARTLLVVLAMAIGLAGAGTVLVTWALVRSATVDGYAASLPVSATLRLDRVEPALLARVRALPEVAAVRARRSWRSAVQFDGRWVVAQLYALDNYGADGLGRLLAEAGAWPPADGGIAIEQSSLQFGGAALGRALVFAAAGGATVELPVTAVVRDVSLAPGWMEHVVYGYASAATLVRLGAPDGFDELQLRVANPATDRAAVRRVAATVQQLAEQGGRRVLDSEVPEPGRHIHAAQMESLLLTQGAFGLLALLACAFLVVNLLSALLAGQVREIGVMKTLGAGNSQLAAMYLGLALLLGALATLLALPVAVALGWRYAAFKLELLNFPLAHAVLPWWPLWLLAASGLLLPLAAAALPVRRGCRLPVQAALRDYGLAAVDGQARRWLPCISGLGRPLLLALGNAFRRRQRLLLTLAALAAGGAVFLGAASLRAAVIGSVDLLYAAQLHDFSLRLAKPQPPEQLEAVAATVAGVRRAEAWSGGRATPLQPDGLPGTAFVIAAPAPDTRLLQPRLLAGRWLQDSGAAELVVGRALLRDQPGLAPGQSLRLRIEGRELDWQVVGIADSGPTPQAWTGRAALAAARGSADLAGTLLVSGSARGLGGQLDLIRRLRLELEQQGMAVVSSQRPQEQRRVVEDHLLMVVDFLAVMGWVMLAVGAMGLASTMGLAVLERTREIGVLRTLGARHGAILLLVLVEGLMVALLGWLLAVPLSMPVALLLGEAFGRVMFTLPRIWLPEPAALLQWLLLAVGIALLACALPAWRALRIRVAAALQYE